jgi:hypothetical protein
MAEGGSKRDTPVLIMVATCSVALCSYLFYREYKSSQVYKDKLDKLE